MKKSFRDKVRDALARKHIIVITSDRPAEGITSVDFITAKVAFEHFYGKNFLKSITWTVDNKGYVGILYISGYKFVAQGKTKRSAMLRLARQFNDTVPLFTANGKEIERQVEA